MYAIFSAKKKRGLVIRDLMNWRIPTSLTLALFTVVTCGVPCEASDYRVRKSGQSLIFDIAINRNPPVLGENEIRIEIKDPQGNLVLGAEVLVNYYMPPMPRMPPMNYTVPAPLKDGAYRAVMNLVMVGPWNIVIRAKNEEKRTQLVFPIDVR
jgi:hypothetical protein